MAENKICQFNLFEQKAGNNSIYSRIIRNKRSVLRNLFKSQHDPILKEILIKVRHPEQHQSLMITCALNARNQKIKLYQTVAQD